MSKATEKYRIRRERLRELIDLGMDYGEIAKDEGKSESTIYNEIRECGLRRRYMRRHPERRGSYELNEKEKEIRRGKLREMIARGGGAASLVEIAGEFGWSSKWRAGQVLREEGYYEWWNEKRKDARKREVRERNMKVIGYLRIWEGESGG